jgi:hypothetical protein
MEQAPWERYPLLNTMTKLRKARFNASERLARRYKWNSLALIVFSIYSLALSILPKYFSISPTASPDIIGFAAVISSVFVVALSVYSAFSEDIVRSKYSHDNAKLVTSIYHEYKIMIDNFETKGGSKPDDLDFQRRYQSVIDSCQYNHDQIDFQSVRTELETLTPIQKTWIWWQINSSIYFWPVLAIVGPLLLILIALRFRVS